MNPVVSVQEITGEQTREIVSRHNPQGVDLNGTRNAFAAVTESKLNDLICSVRKHGGRTFILDWEGDRTPRGARVLNHEIEWTQHGQIRIASVEKIGTYDRLVESGGASGKAQKMLVYLSPSKSR